MKKKYYKYLDFIRLISCILVLFYHLNIIKGGYLAVCTFFVLSGYLSVISAIKNNKFSFKEYYLSRLKKIYLPLLIVVFLTIVITSLISNYNWINLKPEVTSIIFGYNNYWQLNANLDYFVRNVTSPFTHFWYISILIQFELVFPFLFILLRKLGRTISKLLPCLIFLILGILSSILFNNLINNNHIMQAYYGTFARSFSLFFGMFLGFIHAYYKPLIIKNKTLSNIIFYIYLIILITLSFIISNKSILFNISMFISTFISIRLIDYAINNVSENNSFDNIIASLSKISYEIYLVQYPIIFLMQNYKINGILKVLLIIVITFCVSYLLHFSLDLKGKSKKNIIRIVLLMLITLISISGFYTYFVSKNYTEDIKKLKNDLSENNKLIKKRQEEYLLRQKEEDKEWQDYLDSADKNEKDLESVVRNLKIIGIGDSIMELAVKNLYKEFPNGYFDAATNRTEKASMDVIRDLKAKGIDSDVYLLNIGTNGWCNESCKEELLNIIGNDKYVFWVNATSPDYEAFNPTLESFASKHDNVFIIDWRSYGLLHQEYLIYDKVHPNVTGCGIYASKLFEGVYNHYLEILNKKKEEKIREHEEKEKNKITFIGNDLLSGIYDLINDNYVNKKILVKKYNYNELKELLSDKTLSNNVVLVFDNSISLSNNQYQELVNICGNRNISIINMSNISKINGANIIDFDTDNITFDKIHLNDKGNKELFNLIKSEIKEDS